MTPIGTDRTENYVIFENNSAIERADVKGKLTAAGGQARDFGVTAVATHIPFAKRASPTVVSFDDFKINAADAER